MDSPTEEDVIQVPGAEIPYPLLEDEKKQIVLEFLERVRSIKTELSEDTKTFLDEYSAYRYLRARKWNEDTAEEMFIHTLEWRETKKPHKLTAQDLESQIRKGHMYCKGFDKYRRPITWLKVHQQEDLHTEDQKLDFMIHAMQIGTEMMEKTRGVQKMVWVVDCAGYSLKHNGSLGFAQKLLDILQNHYPERLGALVLKDTPFIFRVFWRMISPFVDPQTCKKISFISSDSIEEFVEEYFHQDDVQDLPITYGGEYEFDGDEVMERYFALESKEKSGKKKRKRKKKKKSKK